MVTLKQILDEIEELKKQAEAIRRKERIDVIAEIKRGIQLYEITPDELGLKADDKRKYKKTK